MNTFNDRMRYANHPDDESDGRRTAPYTNTMALPIRQGTMRSTIVSENHRVQHRHCPYGRVAGSSLSTETLYPAQQQQHHRYEHSVRASRPTETPYPATQQRHRGYTGLDNNPYYKTCTHSPDTTSVVQHSLLPAPVRHGVDTSSSVEHIDTAHGADFGFGPRDLRGGPDEDHLFFGLPDAHGRYMCELPLPIEPPHPTLAGPSYLPTARTTSQPVKRGPGRPKGSANKKKVVKNGDSRR